MKRFQMNKKEKDEILENVIFTKRQKEIFEKLVEGNKIRQIEKDIDCSLRMVSYEINKIDKKIDAFRNNKEITLFYVYIHIFPNDKKYVGVTENVSQRWGNYGLPYSKNIKMYEDIIKYGWENVRHEIVLETKSSYKARQLEKKLIEIFDLTDEKKGYNKTI